MIVQVKWKGDEKLAFFNQHIALVRKRYMIQPSLQWKVHVHELVCDLPNGAIYCDLEWPVTWISRSSWSCQYPTLNMSFTAGLYKTDTYLDVAARNKRRRHLIF